MATAATIKKNIAKLEAALKSKATPKSLKPKLETQLVKSKAELSGMNKGTKPKTSSTKSTQTALQKLKEMVNKNKKYKTYKGAGVDLEKDADRPALRTGKRIAKESGKTYYEYRANRIDVKQPPKRYPKLEKGGYMAKGGKTKKGDVGKSGTQYGYTLKEYEEMGEKNGLFVSPKEWWSSREGKKYTDSFGRTKTIGSNSQDERQEMQSYGYRIAIGMDLGRDKIPASARKYVIENNLTKEEQKYAKGGETSSFSNARLLGRESQDFEKEAREYAGADWDKMSKDEKEQIISDMQKDFDRSSHFAKGGETKHDKIEEMVEKYQTWLDKNNLPQMSADELLVDESVNLTKEQRKYIQNFANEWDEEQDKYAKGGETKVAKFKVEDMVYSYQNKDYAAPINYVKFSPWDSTSGSHPNDTYKYRLSLKDGNSKWTDEKSLYKTKQKEYAKGGEVDYSKQTSDDFKLGEIVWDTDNKRYGTIIGIYDKYASDKYEVRLDTDGMQPTENLRKVGSKGDKGTKEQLNYEIELYADLIKKYPKNNYPQQRKEFVGQYAKGGISEKEVVESNAEMVLSQIKAVKHHAQELSNVVSKNSDIEAWVVAKIERASTDLSDITHYLEYQTKKMAMGGEIHRTQE